MASTLEFWRDNGQIYVEFNLGRYTLAEFMHLPEAGPLLDQIYNRIILDYQKNVNFSDTKMKIVADFITENFLEKDHTMDVIILGNGEVVKFNIEKP